MSNASSSGRFVGRRVLVTGGSGGIGAEVCRRFAREGARVAVHYGRREAAAEEVRQALEAEPSHAGGHVALGADLADAAAARALVEEAIDALGGIDVLVNNAGVFELHAPLDSDFETWTRAWRRALDINLAGAAHAAWAAARHMSAHGGGRIVNVSSRGAFRGEPESPAYGASKAGLNALSQSLAAALAPHDIFVYAVAPGFVETAMARPHLAGDRAQAVRNQSPLGRVATVGDVAYWVLAMAAEGAEFATGTILDVNGASYLRT
ncbi:MAG: SDR family oxidoreductase [Acidobacteriota bacterium]